MLLNGIAIVGVINIEIAMSIIGRGNRRETIEIIPSCFVETHFSLPSARFRYCARQRCYCIVQSRHRAMARRTVCHQRYSPRHFFRRLNTDHRYAIIFQ